MPLSHVPEGLTCSVCLTAAEHSWGCLGTCAHVCVCLFSSFTISQPSTFHFLLKSHLLHKAALTSPEVPWPQTSPFNFYSLLLALQLSMPLHDLLNCSFFILAIYFFFRATLPIPGKSSLLLGLPIDSARPWAQHWDCRVSTSWVWESRKRWTGPDCLFNEWVGWTHPPVTKATQIRQWVTGLGGEAAQPASFLCTTR